MNLLAFDTSGTACSVALLHQQTIYIKHEIVPMQQAKQILPMIQSLLKEANMQLSDLSAIAFGVGPGSFTGLRIASSVAQGLAFVADKPVIPVSSLAAMAQTAFLRYQWQHIWIAVDARVNKIYWAKYKMNSRGLVELVGKERVSDPAEIEKNLTIAPWYGVGDGWQAYREVFSQLDYLPKDIDIKLQAHAEAIIQLAQEKYHKKEWVSAFDATPIYLR